jgi:hypothetical protein
MIEATSRSQGGAVDIVADLAIRFFGGLVLGLPLMAATIGGMKDRYGLVVAGLLLIPVVAFIVGPDPVIGASALPGLFVIVLWIVAGARLGKPWSVWARTFYDSKRMAVAQARFPSRAERPIRPMPVLPSRPRVVEVAFGLLLVVYISALVSDPVTGALAGPLLVFVVMARMGHNWARITVTVLVCLLCGIQLRSLVQASPLVLLSLVFFFLTAAAALVLLYRPAANRFFHLRDEASESPAG